MNPDDEYKRFREAGVREVRKNIAAGIYGSRQEKLAREWVKESGPDWHETTLGKFVLGVVIVVVSVILLKAFGLG